MVLEMFQLHAAKYSNNLPPTKFPIFYIIAPTELQWIALSNKY